MSICWGYKKRVVIEADGEGRALEKIVFIFSFLSTLSSLTNRTRFVSLWASSFKNQPKCHFTTRNSNELCNYLLIWYWNWKIANCKRDEARNEVKAIFLFFWILFFTFSTVAMRFLDFFSSFRAKDWGCRLEILDDYFWVVMETQSPDIA